MFRSKLSAFGVTRNVPPGVEKFCNTIHETAWIIFDGDMRGVEPSNRWKVG